MDLAIITDTDMHNEVINLLAPEIGGGLTRVWIGLKWQIPPTSHFSWVNNEEMGPFTNWDTGEPNCMEGTNAEPTPCPAQLSYDQNCVRLQHVSTTSWVWKTHGCYRQYAIICQTLSSSTKTSITTEAQTSIVSSTTGAQTTTVAGTTDAQTTTVASTPDTTVMETTSESTKKQLFTSFTYSVSESAATTVSSKTNPTTSPEPQVLPMITTTEQETSFKPNTDYIPVEFTMLGIFFVNSTQICSCHLLSNQTNMQGKNWNFKIDKRSTNAYIRQHTSAYDGRLSSRIMGYTGIFFIGGVLLFVLFADLTTFLDKKRSEQSN
ncbi:Hypothetical predicted protein [Mytilus galloprovincialis]|uniref:C-type lectin domain-containing protein n=1 Tax=Mytilus galloprovincialis TaxID=29158 RepID=A0A8B6FCQ2_MYTGA|nr:Hypothetical predicted protein [Mytilus galloprovincialis]